MISSPGAVIASTACMNAMFAPAVTMTRTPRATSMPFSGAQLERQPLDQRRQAGAVLILVRRRVGQRAADGVERRLRRPVVDHPLAE